MLHVTMAIGLKFTPGPANPHGIIMHSLEQWHVVYQHVFWIYAVGAFHCMQLTTAHMHAMSVVMVSTLLLTMLQGIMARGSPADVAR